MRVLPGSVSSMARNRRPVAVRFRSAKRLCRVTRRCSMRGGGPQPSLHQDSGTRPQTCDKAVAQDEPRLVQDLRAWRGLRNPVTGSDRPYGVKLHHSGTLRSVG